MNSKPLEKISNAIGVDDAIKKLREGYVIACATDTVYGLLVDPNNQAAVHKIFKLKGRQEKKPLQLLALSAEAARTFIEIPGRHENLLNYWPGGLTIVGRRKRPTAKGVGTAETIGIRVPSGKTIREILQKFNGPLAATSANASGQPSATTARMVNAYFGQNMPIVAADAEVRAGIGSTVVDITGPNIKILRKGEVKLGSLDSPTPA